jgi:nitrous-oxide reductase
MNLIFLTKLTISNNYEEIPIVAFLSDSYQFLIGRYSCNPKNIGNTVSSYAALKAYVASGKYDEYHNFVSRGFNRQMIVYGLPSVRISKIVQIFFVLPENAYGYSEETKPMLNTSHGFMPWDDQHQLELS